MTDQTLPGHRARNQTVRAAFAEARGHGVARRHLRRLMRLAGDHPCRCGDKPVHRHACSYRDLVRALDSGHATLDST